MGFIDQVPRWLSGLLLISLLGDCLPPTLSTSGHGKPHAGWKPARPSPTPFRDPLLHTIALWCHESSMEVVVLADLYGTGALIDAADLWLGRSAVAKGSQPGAECGAVPSGEGQYTILVALTDCGTQLSLTEDSLLYTNTLVYSPAISPDGIVRMEGIEVPVECHYKREYSVSSGILVPTWIPFVSTQSAENFLHFSLRLLTGDLRSERPSNVFHLGDLIHLEASVEQGNHVPLRVFVDFCIATLVPDMNADPRYIFIESGCFIDAELTGSRSRFLPSAPDDKLQFQLDTFTFHQDPRRSIFITCLLKAEPVLLGVESVNRICCFIDGRWKSASGQDHVCAGCGQSTKAKDSGYLNKGTFSVGMSKRGTDDDTAMEKTISLGPLIVLATEQMGSPAAERSHTPVDTQATIAVAGNAVDPSAVMTETGALVDTPEMLAAEMESAFVEEPAVLVPRQVDAPDNSELPMAKQSGTSVGTHAIMPVADSAVDSSAVMTETGALVDTEEMLAAELESAFVAAPAILIPRPEEVLNDSAVFSAKQTGTSVDTSAGLADLGETVVDTPALMTNQMGSFESLAEQTREAASVGSSFMDLNETSHLGGTK